MQNLINSREDLDRIYGTQEYEEFMQLLKGTLWRVEKNAANAWITVEDNTTIERFGFTREDFPNVPKPALPVSPQLTQADYESALDAHLDSVAKADRWSNRFTFVARAGYPNNWQQKAIAFGTWMDTCNIMAYELLLKVEAGTVPAPTIEEFIAGLPEFTY